MPHQTQNSNQQRDKRVPEIAVMSCDALGLHRMLDTDDSAGLAADTLDGMLGQIVTAHAVYEETDHASQPFELFQSALYFGDSIYVFGDESDPLRKQITKLTALAGAILWVGITSTLRGKRKSFVPRIGIAVGNLRIRTIDVAGRSIRFRIGQSMARAHDIERGQDWVGGALPAGFHEGDDSNAIAYEVPTHKAYDGPRIAAINWCKTASLNSDQYPPSRLVGDLALHASESTAPDTKRKWNATCDFAQAMLQIGDH